MGCDMDQTTVGDLIADAVTLVEQQGGNPVDLALVREELAAAVACCDDQAAADDGNDVLMQITRAMDGRADSTLPLAS